MLVWWELLQGEISKFLATTLTVYTQMSCASE